MQSDPVTLLALILPEFGLFREEEKEDEEAMVVVEEESKMGRICKQVQPGTLRISWRCGEQRSSFAALIAFRLLTAVRQVRSPELT
ncbi:hypothetical protein E2C01_030083 [Portunus trituberculatus]|uniref:Uncharacterized protein n=1 Tax=Portunus trituberculatus TaxID=210409 RepID=A0A5B7ETQ6_PORTR|nr:hypothetical protein [Portunus trituberculatus]